MKKPNTFSFLFFITSCIFATFSQAAEWRIDPTIFLRTGYNNNITLTASKDKTASPEISLKPSAKFSRNTETSSLTGTIGANFRQYPEESGLNDSNLNLNVGAFKSLQRSNYRLNLNFIKDTTLDSELEETGLVFGRTNRIRQSLNPEWAWRFNDRTNMRLSYTYNKLDYDNNTQGYVDNKSQNVLISLQRALNNRSTLSITTSQTLTDNGNNVLSRYTNLQAGYNYNLSETLSASLSAGARKTTTKYSQDFFLANVIPFAQQVKVEETGSVFSASIIKTAERGKQSLSVSRNINSSVSGRLIEVTRADFDNTFSFSNRLSVSLDLAYYQSQGTSEVSTIDNIDSKYYTISPGLYWNISQFWTVSSNYRFKKQTNILSGKGKNAIQNTFYINLTYQLPRISISR